MKIEPVRVTSPLSKTTAESLRVGPGAVYKLWVEDFPAIVGIDTQGCDLYENLWMRESHAEKGWTLSR